MPYMDIILKAFSCILLIIGAVECFSGFKIVKILLAVWGFIGGTAVGAVIGALSENWIVCVLLALLLGVGAAIAAYKLYLAGVFVLTAFLAFTAIYLITENVFIATIIGVAVGTTAIFFEKPVVIAVTAISGAGTVLSSAYTMMDLNIYENFIVAALLWAPIALSGVTVQYITTQKKKKPQMRMKSFENSMTFSERKYPGMQKAYRNFCIKCGCELFGTANVCPRCNYRYEE